MFDSLIQGFMGSNALGRGIVYMQVISSVVMIAAAFGKWRALSSIYSATRRFLCDFSTCGEVLEYYMQRRPQASSGLEGIYKDTCERLIKLVAPDMLAMMNGSAGVHALTAREIELVRGTCEHRLDEEEIKIEHGMNIIATVVALSPMLGLLGTVWGVLDAFYQMGTAGSANLATIAPSISAALVTTVVGLLIALPGVCVFNSFNARIRNLTSDFEGFADELTTRIACEYQGRGN